MSKKKDTRYEILKPWLTCSKEQYYEAKSQAETNYATPDLVRKTFRIDTKQHKILQKIHIVPDSLPEWTVAFIDVDQQPSYVEFVDHEQFAAQLGYPNLTDSEIRSVIKTALRGVPYASSVYHNKSKKKYPLALLTHPLFKERMKTGITTFINDKKEKERIASLAQYVNPRLRGRKISPEKVVMHLGPTNSGKTRHAIEAMVEEHYLHPDGIVAYGGPLRMLAIEVYESLIEILGEDQVGLITGEQEINPHAPVVACTVECVPESGNLLVVDECHWAMDDDRGKNWTNVLQGAEYEEIVVLGPTEVEPHMRFLLADAEDIQVHHYNRLVPLQAIHDEHGNICQYTVSEVPKKSAVIAFSKKAVLALAQDIADATHYNVAALYGKMPMDARNSVIDKFARGEIDVVVSTDVIGHGINLPIETLLFAETQKFDGQIRRNLKIWEGAQIAGRAGRYGLSETGKVATLQTRWSEPDPLLVQEYVHAAAGEIETELEYMRCVAFPTLMQIGGETIDAKDIPYLLQHWRIAMDRYLQSELDLKHFIKVSSMNSALENLHVIAETSKMMEKTLDCQPLNAQYTWQLMNAPIDSESPVLVYGTQYVMQGITQGFSSLLKELNTTLYSREKVEESYRILTEIMSFILMFGEDGSLPHVATKEQLEMIEKKLIDRYEKLEHTDIPGRCVKCGAKTNAPWLSECESCFQSRKNMYWNNDFGYDYSYSYNHSRLSEEEIDEHNEISRNWNRLKSEANKEVAPWFSVGDKVAVLYKGRTYDATVIKINKVTVKVEFHLQNGDVREKNVDAIYVAKDNGMEDKLKELASYQAFLLAEKPERYW